jgi:hypothetical protein
MKYLLAIYVDESGWGELTPEEAQATTAEYGALSQKMAEAGVLLGGDGLQPVATAKTVRVRDGERVTSDGPFAETKETLGGFFWLDCDSFDEALGWAEQIPGARSGSVEVRPGMIYDEAEQPAAAGERSSG